MSNDGGSHLLDAVLAGERSAFALLSRSDGINKDRLEVLAGRVSEHTQLAELPLGRTANGPLAIGHQLLAFVPYRQIQERGFACADDGTPILALSVEERASVQLSHALTCLPERATVLEQGHFDIDDDEYAELVRRIVRDEIGTGEGSNFVLKRSFIAQIPGFSLASALAVFRRLLCSELGAYWIFLFSSGDRILLGATPERHLSVRNGRAVMNPISGTYRYPSAGPTLEGLLSFLADQKESDELYMVLDEELKMMARICDGGGRVTGPYLREMARLAHSEYFIEGQTTRGVPELIRETLFAPTVTGSPVESAARVIRRYEPAGRGFYSGVAALVGYDEDGSQYLDSAILIRTADIGPSGNVSIGVGSTLVRHSDPMAEAQETRAKLAGLLGALQSDRAQRWSEHPHVVAALRRRNEGIAEFWLRPHDCRHLSAPELKGLRALVIDAQDNFTAMICHQLRALGLSADTRRVEYVQRLDLYDLVVMGPGPGDPRSCTDTRIGRLRAALNTLIEQELPFVAVCLSHQLLSARLGLELSRRQVPNQGVQGEIELFGKHERVGFYNTFVAQSTCDRFEVDGIGSVEVSRNRKTGEVHALRGPLFTSMQFHPESVLTIDGPRILAQAITGCLISGRSLAAMPL